MAAADRHPGATPDRHPGRRPAATPSSAVRLRRPGRRARTHAASPRPRPQTGQGRARRRRTSARGWRAPGSRPPRRASASSTRFSSSSITHQIGPQADDGADIGVLRPSDCRYAGRLAEAGDRHRPDPPCQQGLGDRRHQAHHPGDWPGTHLHSRSRSSTFLASNSASVMRPRAAADRVARSGRGWKSAPTGRQPGSR